MEATISNESKKEAILDAVLTAGEAFSASDIAHQVGVAQNTVRNWLGAWEQEGSLRSAITKRNRTHHLGTTTWYRVKIYTVNRRSPPSLKAFIRLPKTKAATNREAREKEIREGLDNFNFGRY